VFVKQDASNRIRVFPEHGPNESPYAFACREFANNGIVEQVPQRMRGVREASAQTAQKLLVHHFRDNRVSVLGDYLR
jgi:hypothetical protein